MAKEENSGDDKAGEKIVKKKTSKRYENYDQGKLKNKSCPKCGAGIFLAEHKDRLYCGKCHYVEMKGADKPAEGEKKEANKDKKEEKPDEPKKEQKK